MKYEHANLVVSPKPTAEGLLLRVTPQQAGWDYVMFEVRALKTEQVYTHNTGANELCITVLSGLIRVSSSAGNWRNVGARQTVFAGKPYALYLSRNTAFSVTAESDAEIALSFCPAEIDFPAKLITPDEVKIEIRGGDNATRHINSIIPPGFACQRLVVVEVYTPSGSWSSYPPHKHDVHRTDASGAIVEADLEETYFYKFDKPEGYAYQRVYTDETSPMQQAGNPIDAVVIARHNEVVLIPEGYHPVAVPPGYTCYYLNTLAGSAQSLANYEDPAFAWVRQSYKGVDPRVPLY